MKKETAAQGDVILRPLPYPYEAALAICSDVDCTPDFATYLEIMKFLNTPGQTRMGRGVDLEIGNSFYFLAPPFRYAYWNLSESERGRTRELIQSGHIDCLHSIGEDARTREHAANAYEELSRYDCSVQVWVDHSKTPTNLGPDIMKGHGDEVGHSAYHADLMAEYGIRYVWRGSVTGVVGQETDGFRAPRISAYHPCSSAVTLAKHLVKVQCKGNFRFESIAANRLVWPVKLRDGSRCYEFLRSNPHWAGTEHASCCDLSAILVPGVIEKLIRRRGISIIYTHLCAGLEADNKFPNDVVAGFHKLAEYADNKLLVTTTRRLLGYCRARTEVECHNKIMPDGTTELHLSHANGEIPLDRDDVHGLTFYVRDAQKTRIYWNGTPFSNIAVNPPDETGMSSVSIPWPTLRFPDL